MKLNINRLIKESGEDLTQSQLAREMVEAGVFKSHRSAVNMIQYHNHGNSKSVDWELLTYLVKRFNRKGTEIIQWDS